MSLMNKAGAGQARALATLALGLVAGPLAAAPAAPDAFDSQKGAHQVVEIRSPVVGLLQAVHARRGELIRAGQRLVTIESSVERSAADAAQLRAEAQGGLQLARNKLAAAREKARRLTELAAEEFVSAQARDDAVAEHKAAESELRNAEESQRLAQAEHRQSLDQLNRRVITAPFSGVVVDQYLHPGALVDAGDSRKPILKIAQTQPLAVQAILPFKLFPQVQPGRKVSIQPEAPFGGEIEAVIRTKDRVIDSAAGTFGIVATLDNARQTLPAGVRCRVRLK